MLMFTVENVDEVEIPLHAALGKSERHGSLKVKWLSHWSTPHTKIPRARFPNSSQPLSKTSLST